MFIRRLRAGLHFLILSVCLCATAPAHALDGRLRLGDFHRDTWGSKEGAPPTIISIAQTNDGWIWLGTFQGLYRFDGVQFERFVPASGEQLIFSAISTLTVATNGDLLIGYLTGGLSVLHAGHLRHLTSVERQPFSSTFNAFADVDGTYWASALDGLFHFDGNKWAAIGTESGYPGVRTDNVIADRYGRLFVSDGKDVYRLDRDRRRFTPTGLRSAANNPDFVFDASDNLWIGANDSMVPVPPPRVADKTKAIPVRTGSTLRRLFDRNGNLWLVVNSEKLCLVSADKLSATRTISTSPDDVNDNCMATPEFHEIRQMLEDDDGNIWMVTSKGLTRIRHKRLRTIAYPVPANRAALLQDAGGGVTLLVGTPLARYHIDDTALRKQIDADEPVLFQRAGIGSTMLLATESALIVQRPDGQQRIPYPVPAPDKNDRVGRLIQQDASTFWVAWPVHGLWRYAGGQWSKPDSDGKPVGRAAAGSDGRGHVWIAYANNTLVEVGANSRRKYDSSDGIDVRVVTFLDFQRETLISGDGGLQVLEGGRFRHLRADDPDLLAGINGLIVAPDGDRWFNTRRGVLHVRAADWRDAMRTPDTRLRYELLDQLDGYPDGPQLGVVSTTTRTPDGRMWFAANGSVALYDPRYDHPVKAAPRPVIRTLAVGNAHLDVSQPVVLQAGNDLVTLSFTALSYIIPERTVFRYRLEGVDAEWQGPVTARSVSYAHLAPGTYTFALQAALKGGDWSTTTAQARFEIMPRFTQTRTFAILCGLALLLVLGLLHRLRVRRITRRLREQAATRQHERERIARELHDTVLQTNFALLLQVRAVAEVADIAIGTRLDTIVSQAQASFSAGRDKVAGLRAHQDAQSTFDASVKHLVHTLAGDSTLILSCESHGTPWPLNEYVVRESLSIIAEAVTNIRKHARAQTVRIDIRFGLLACTVAVTDDGRGIPSEHLAGRLGHWGISGMHERAALIKARLRITSGAHGTTVCLRIPRWRVGLHQAQHE